MHWTFDPLAARNARLNLQRLGARVDEFVVDMYGSNTGSPLHELGTDRFVVSWPVSSEPAPLPGDEALLEGAPCVAGPPGLGPAAGDPLPDAGSVAVLVPGDHAVLFAGDPARARAWHAAVRRALAHYVGRGWRVCAFVVPREGDAGYVLTRPAGPAAVEPLP